MDYYPYGDIRLDEKAGTFNEQRKYAGQEYDVDTGLNYMNSRYYNGKMGRFVSVDPAFLAIGDNGQVKAITGQELQQILSDPQALNSYVYARNNPLRIVDPTGRWYWEVLTGKQSWSDFTIEVGQAANYLYENDQTWKTAMDHPVETGATVGVAGGLAAAGGAAVATRLSVAYLQGAGTICLFNCNSIVQNAPKWAEQGYRSFDAFKNAVGSADPSGQNLRQWHHIVEQNPANREQFGQQALQNAKNIVNIPSGVHRQISGYYSSIKEFTNGQTVRDWLSTQSFAQQAEFGNKIIDKVVNKNLR